MQLQILLARARVRPGEVAVPTDAAYLPLHTQQPRRRKEASMDATHYDAVVVGSGFGGSVMAYRLAEAGLRVAVLERGKRYPPNSFPRSPYRLKTNFWD